MVNLTRGTNMQNNHTGKHSPDEHDLDTISRASLVDPAYLS